jgi:glucose/arabinose dehydrogenase
LTKSARGGVGAVLVVAAALSLWACAGGASGDTPAATTAATHASVHRYVKNANQAVGLAFDTRGRLLYAEKDNGKIIRYSRGRKTTLAKLGVSGGGEPGLLGLAVAASGETYAYYTSSNASCPDPTKSSAGGGLKGHCIWAFKPSGGRLVADHLVFSAPHPSTAQNHVGGGLHIGPDKELYLGLGDLGENDNPSNGPGRSQSLSVPFGKILRLNPAGTNEGASGNPSTCGNADNSAQRDISDGRIWACGLRNPYSYAWDSSGRMWVADVGDSCDEINIVKPGVNYGWQPPRTDCSGAGSGRPILKVTGTPSGVAIPLSKLAGSWRNDVFYCLFVPGKLIRYDASSRKSSTIAAGAKKCGYDMVSRGRYIYMSAGDDIYRLAIKR